MNDPKIYLAIDNCFALKRWTKPAEWMEIIKYLGLNYVEASTDNECDPLYTSSEYIDDWIKETKTYAHKMGINVITLYSGHGTYSTLGLAHDDLRISNKILNEWLKPLIKIASKLNAGVGFYCHAFSDTILQDRYKYIKAEENLYTKLSNLAEYAKENGVNNLSIEQMYSPHQIPWTIKGAKKLLKSVFKMSGCPFYITIDTGHQIGQKNFLYPSREKIMEYLSLARQGRKINGLWLGPKTAYDLFEKAVNAPIDQVNSLVENLENEMNQYPHLFAEEEDSDTYCWLEQLGCYSPIIHLQQNDGTCSSHYPFTDEYNKNGLVVGEKILNSLKISYDSDNNEKIRLPKVDVIYLTLEIFASTAAINIDILNQLKDSVKYWRKFIPSDGLPLSMLINKDK